MVTVALQYYSTLATSSVVFVAVHMKSPCGDSGESTQNSVCFVCVCVCVCACAHIILCNFVRVQYNSDLYYPFPGSQFRLLFYPAHLLEL
jgi:hypothetical protein